MTIYQDRGEDKADARLGLELADWLLNGRTDFPIKRPDWIKPQHVGVFTVENDPGLHTRLEYLKITVFEHKTAGLPDTVLVEIINRIKTQKPDPKNGK